MSETTKIRTIEVRYHIEDSGVGAEIPAVPAWTVVGGSVAEVRDLVIDGLEFATGDRTPFELHETFDDLRQGSGAAAVG
jgi:hypothetical protein